MSRTNGHIRARRNDNFHNDDYEYSDSFKASYDNPFNGGEVPTGWDVSKTTLNGTDFSIRPYRRHPNKKHRVSLGCEFSQTDVSRTKCNPYGDVTDRSYRCRKSKFVGNKQRRTRMKEITKDIIAQELDED